MTLSKLAITSVAYEAERGRRLAEPTRFDRSAAHPGDARRTRGALPQDRERVSRSAPLETYAELLRRGQVSSPEGVDPDEWREEIRRKARQDKIRVITSRDGAGAFAMLNRKIPDDQAMEAMRHALIAPRCWAARSSKRRAGSPAEWLARARRRVDRVTASTAEHGSTPDKGRRRSKTAKR